MPESSRAFDLIIVGGGLVGGSLALALASSGLELALIEAHAPRTEDAEWDSRIYAISPGSVEFLEHCGVWGKLDRTRIAPVSAMRIRGDDDSSQLEFDAYRAGLSELAFIVESRAIETAMHTLIEAQPNLRRLFPAECESIKWNTDAARVIMRDGSAMTAKLVVGADGGDSWVRAQAAIADTTHDYRQRAVVANFACERSHDGVAHQWFRKDGVLALLPLPGSRASMVWSTRNDNADRLIALSKEALCGKVEQASQSVLGRIEMIGEPHAFPLRLQRVKQLVKPRLALIGDAAHVLHPLAGQGVNLGFQDARELAAVLKKRGPQSDCGDYLLLRRYERARKEAIAAMQFTTDSLQKLFSNDGKILARLRNAGLAATDRMPRVKRLLIEHALG